MDQVGQDLLFAVCIRAKISIGALADAMWVVEAKIFFIFFRVVVLLYY